MDRKHNRLSQEYLMLQKIKSRAKIKGIPFEIDTEDIEIPDKCPYLGIDMIKGAETGIKCSPSIDRITPEKGYVKGNVRIISHKANTMKSNASVDELITFAKNVLKIHDKENE